MTSSFWKALKTIFITLGNHQQQQSLDKRKHKRSKHNQIDYESTIIDDSYLHTTPTNISQNENSNTVNNNNNNNNNNNIVNNNNSIADNIYLPNQNDTLHEDMIDWPQWALDLEKRHDLQLVSRNGLDVDENRSLAGFKGRNFVYQDRKFVTRYYWRGYSSIIHDQLIPENATPDINMTDEYSHPFSNLKVSDRSLVGYVFWNINCEGPPGCVHGGALASVFDDSMACCIRYFYNNNYDEEGQTEEDQQQITNNNNNNNNNLNNNNNQFKQKKYAVTANLSVNYKKFVPLLSVTLIETKIERREGKKIFVTSVIKDQSGSVRAEATAIWIVINMSSVMSPSQTPSTSTSTSPSSMTPREID